MTKKLPFVLGFAASSGTGKTSLLTQLLPLLKQQGLKVAVVKHSHHDVEIDQPGKDSFRLRMAGATPVLLASAYRQILIAEHDPQLPVSLAEQLALLQSYELDLILVEGFRQEAFAKIELHRPSLGKPLLYPHDPNIIAIASDSRLPVPADLPLLDLNDIQAILAFILDYYQELAHD